MKLSHKKNQRQLKGQGKKIGIVCAKFNEVITQRLLKACLEELRNLGVKDKDITSVWVPGSFDIPLVALKIAKKKNIDAVICLGAVIKGETYHFEMIAQGVARGIGRVALLSEKPVIFGILTTYNESQAYRRSESPNNKGKDAAVAAIEMANLITQI